MYKSSLTQGRNHNWKVEGNHGWVPTPGRLHPAPSKRLGWVLGTGGGCPLSLRGSGGITPEKFGKTQMLNPAFWWLLAVKFLAFWKLRPRSWRPIHCWSPILKVGGPVSPGSCGCCAYALTYLLACSWVRIW